VVKRLLVDRALLLRVEQERLDLRPEHEPAVVDSVVERLDPDAVAHEPQPALPFVPQGEGEHAAKPVQALDPPLLVRVHDRLGVRMVRDEGVAADPLELLPHRRVVVDLAVVDELDRAVLVRNRLVRGVREIDDREPSRAQADAPVGRDPGPRAVRPAVRERVAHPRDVGLLDLERSPGECSGDSAHVRPLSPARRRRRRGRWRRARPPARPRAGSGRPDASPR
jgi:hypothetical protein